MRRLNFDRSVWRRRSRNIAIGFVALTIVVGIVGFFVAPGVVKSVAEKQITEKTGRRATIGTLAINPYTLSATIGELKLYQPDASTVAVEIGEIFANVSSASLFRRALVFDELRVARPRVSIARLDAQRFDFSDVVDRLAAQPKSDEPARFSLNNITLEDGSIVFDDRVTGRKHTIDHIGLGLPFVSNLPYATDVFVTPKFVADVNGSRIELNGKAQPFSDDRAATLEFDIADLDLPTYMAFSPVPLRFEIAKAKVGTHLVIQFHAAGKTPEGKATPQSLVLSGHVDVTDLKITDRASHEAISVKRIEIDADKVDPFQSVFALKKIAVVEPHVAATRRADGSIDLVSLFALPPDATAAKPAPPAAAPSISIASAVVENGRVSVTDETLATPTTTTFDGLNVSLENVALQGNAATAFAVSVRTPDEGTIEVKGDAVVARRAVNGTFQLRKSHPGAFSQYIAGFLAARIGDGSIDADGRYRIDASGPALTGGIDGLSAHVTKLRSLLPNEKTSFVAADAIALEGGAFDFATRAFSADTLTVTAPVVVVARDAKGRWNLQAALIEKAPGKPQAPAERDAAIVVQAPDARPFTALVKALVVERGDVTLQDDAQSVPVRLRVAPLNVKLSNIGTAAGSVVPFSIDAGIERRGKLSIDGKLTAQPLSLDANVDASNVAVGWLAAYAGNRLNIVVDSADLNARGTVRVQTPARPADATPSVAYRGSLGIVRLRAVDRATSEEFVRWKTLDIPQFEFQMPAKNAPLSVATGPVALDDFYARVIVNANGRLNLQDVVATPGESQSVTTPDAVATPAVAKTPTVAKPTPVPDASTAPKPQVQVKGIKLTNGRIGITDNFVKPNYSANLTSLTGEVSTIASDDPKPATVRLDGKIDGDGVLTVSGQTNPFAPTLFTDISAEAKDIELTRLSTYAIKYAGYAIARGKLSTTVKYHIENGKLDAQNRLFLDQLTFGEKVDSPTATKLPVLLAVALLKNSRGEIDVSLPVSGSLSDPEFSIGGVIVRVIVNLLTRAVASPFSLIASAFGGSGADELGYVQFKPGVSDMTPEGKAKVETLAKALADRPALKLDIIGRFDPATDPEGIKRDHLLDRLKDLKAKDLSKNGDRVGRNDVTIEPAEYAGYLAKVYDDTKLQDKPRNVVGLAKTIPTEEMEKLLLANMKLEADDPRWLAEARADVVRHFMEDTGKVSPSRIFLVTPKLTADGISDKGLPNRVDFALR